jgi:hypothetical protein
VTPKDGHQTPAWRSSPFAQPLLIMTIGTVGTTAVAVAVWQASRGSFPDYITVIGLLVTGLVAGIASPDSRLGLLAALIVAAVLGIAMAVLEARDVGPLGFLLGAAFATGLMLIFIGLGFGVGRWVNRARGRTADAVSHR